MKRGEHPDHLNQLKPQSHFGILISLDVLLTAKKRRRDFVLFDLSKTLVHLSEPTNAMDLCASGMLWESSNDLVLYLYLSVRSTRILYGGEGNSVVCSIQARYIMW